MDPRDRLVVALDRSSRDDVLALVETLRGTVGTFKIGLEAFVANGPDLVREIAGRGQSVFLDLKLHDIPNTVARAVRAVAPLGVSMLTIHTAGGSAMMRAAAEAAAEAPRPPLVLGVTVLTSLDDAALTETGMSGGTTESVERLARLALRAGLDGVVASPREIQLIRTAAPDLKIVTPGIRGTADAAGDQARTLSAREAVQAGADYIVVGRPITGAADPRAVAEALVADLS